MKCSKAMKEFLELNQGEQPSPDFLRHIENCPSCSLEVSQLSALFTELRFNDEIEASAAQHGESLISDVFAALNARASNAEEPAGQEISLRNWIITGIVIISGITLIPFSTFLPDLGGLFGGTLSLAVPLSLGISLTVYATLFIGTHMKDFQGLLHSWGLNPRDQGNMRFLVLFTLLSFLQPEGLPARDFPDPPESFDAFAGIEKSSPGFFPRHL